MTEVHLRLAVLSSADDGFGPKHAVVRLAKNGLGDRVQVVRTRQGPVGVEGKSRGTGVRRAWRLAVVMLTTTNIKTTNRDSGAMPRPLGGAGWRLTAVLFLALLLGMSGAQPAAAQPILCRDVGGLRTIGEGTIILDLSTGLRFRCAGDGEWHPYDGDATAQAAPAGNRQANPSLGHRPSPALREGSRTPGAEGSSEPAGNPIVWAAPAALIVGLAAATIVVRRLRAPPLVGWLEFHSDGRDSKVDLSSLKAPATLGLKGNIHIEGPGVKPRHAELRAEQDDQGNARVVVRPLQGRVSVVRRGESVPVIFYLGLRDGDILLLGDLSVRFHLLASG